MQYQALLNRSWQIFKTNRTLWWLAFILALVGQGGGNFNTSWIQDMPSRLGDPGGPPPDFAMSEWFPALLLVFVCFALLIIVLFSVVRYVTRVGFIQAVLHAEEEQSITIREALRLGWSRHAWRLFLIDFLVGIVIFVLLIFFFALPLCALIFFIEEGADALAGGAFLLFGMMMMIVGFVVLMVVALVFSMLTSLASRAVVINDLGVFESLSEIGALIREHPKPVVIVALIALGIQILSGIAQFVIILMSIPLLLGLVALWLATSSWALVMIFAIVGIFMLWLVVGVVHTPFVGYLETYWTLAYQELHRLFASTAASLDV